MRVIQLKWSDETVWKTHETAEADTDAQIKRLTVSWLHERAKNKLKHDAEFRVHDLDLADSLRWLLKDCPKPVVRSDDWMVNDAAGGNIDDAYEIGRRDGEADLAQQIRDLLNA
jgi:hypothetical protein